MISLLNEFELAFGKLTNEPKSNQVIYVENGLNPNLKIYVQLNLGKLTKLFDDYGLEFVYLTDWIDKVNDADLQQTAKYYIPWLKPTDLEELRNALAINIKELQSRLTPSDASGAVFDSKGQAFKIDVSDPHLFYEQFRQIAEAYAKKAFANKRKMYYRENFDDLFRKAEALIREEEADYIPMPVERESVLESPSLENKELDDLFKQVKALLPPWIIKEMLAEKLRQNEVISRIEISYKKTIYLPDYDITIRLRPVEMAFYILFLKHPEGINFLDLIDYKDELMRYYRHYATNSDPESIKSAIDNVVNPFNENNRNVQRSRIQLAINEAFKGQFYEAYAKNYMITGGRGEEKKITLPREKVVWLADL